jgi:deoxyribodipyrimidine photolyase-like uncharacterized protein
MVGVVGFIRQQAAGWRDVVERLYWENKLAFFAR